MRWIYKIFRPFQFARCEEALRDEKKFNKPIDLSHEKELFQHYISISIFIISVVPIAIINSYFHIKISSVFVILILAGVSFLLSLILCNSLKKKLFFEKVLRIYNIYIKDSGSIYSKRTFALLIIYSFIAIPFIIMLLIFQINSYLNQ